MNLSRRAFLSRSSIGIALAGAAMAVPALGAVIKTSAAADKVSMPNGNVEPLVAHVRDLSSGEVSLMVGTEQVVVRDANLAARLYGAVFARKGR